MQVVRNGLRAVAFGGGASGTLELRFMAANADIQNGDRLVTSGIDGIYPPGLPVATVIAHRDATPPTLSRASCASRPPASTAAAIVLVLPPTPKPPAAPGGGAADKANARRQGPAARAKDARWSADEHAAAHPAAGARGTIVVSFAAGAAAQPPAVARPARWCRTSSRWCWRSGACASRAWSAWASAWPLGLLMDAGNGVLLGQHALAYSLLAFGGICAVAAHPVVRRWRCRRCTSSRCCW